jgi:phage tail-like protein
MPVLGEQIDSFTSLYFVVRISEGLDYLGTFSEVSGIGMELDVYTYEEGGSNDFIWKLPKHVKFPNVVLKYGMTDSRVLEQWITKFLRDRKRARVEIGTKQNVGQEPTPRWTLKEAFPVKWTGPTFSASQNQVAMETLEIAHHGFVEV